MSLVDRLQRKAKEYYRLVAESLYNDSRGHEQSYDVEAADLRDLLSEAAAELQAVSDEAAFFNEFGLQQ